jgi:hypothetical protein
VKVTTSGYGNYIPFVVRDGAMATCTHPPVTTYQAG